MSEIKAERWSDIATFEIRFIDSLKDDAKTSCVLGMSQIVQFYSLAIHVIKSFFKLNRFMDD